VFFRVDRIYEDITIVVECGGKQAARFRRDYAVPGEMEKIRIPKKLISGEEIVVRIEEGRGKPHMRDR